MKTITGLVVTTHGLNFAQNLVKTSEEDGGPCLIAKADVPVCKRFPLKEGENWFSPSNGQKAYEMMSCYVGLLELYKVTRRPELLHAVETAEKHVEDEEINISRSGSSYVCWT